MESQKLNVEITPGTGKASCTRTDAVSSRTAKVLSVFIPALLMVLTLNLNAESVIWPLTPIPQGGNTAAIARPRADWFERFQSNLDKAKAAGQIDLIFDGDSITDGWQGGGKNVWNERYGKLKAFDFGISGDRVETVLWRLQNGQVDGLDPKLIVLMIGTNNGRNNPDEIAEGIKLLVGDYLKRCPKAHMLLLGVFPRSASPTDGARAKIIQINQKIAALADGKRVTFLDIGAKFLEADGTLSKEVMPDGLHPSPKGYQIWADAIQSEIDKQFPPGK